MWGYIKMSVYQSPVTSTDDMQKHITDAVMTTKADMLLRTQQQLQYRLEVVRATNSAYTELY